MCVSGCVESRSICDNTSVVLWCYCKMVHYLISITINNCMAVNLTYCTLKAGCAIFYSSFLLCLSLRLYVIWPASHPWGAYPIRLAVLQCVPTDLMRSEWLTGLSLLPAVFFLHCFTHTCHEKHTT